VDGAVVDEDRVGVERDLRVCAREVGGDLPVGRGAAAVEQPGRGEDERARAHRRGAAAASRGGGGRRHQQSVGGDRSPVGRAGDDQRVDAPGQLGEGAVGAESRSAAGHDVAAVG
jgi:hypothetical protein